MTTPELLISPDRKYVAYRSEEPGLSRVPWTGIPIARDARGIKHMTPDAVADWLPLVPAVSPAPDTEALRAYLRRTIGANFERRLIAAELLDDDDALSVLRVFEDVVPAIEREITSRHEAFVLMLADAKSERDERIAGLRAALDRARADAERVGRTASDLVEAVAQYKQNWHSARDANHQALETIAQLRRELAGARPIPDDAEERQCNWRCPDEAVNDGLCPEHVQQSWATPTTDPAPAAADGTREPHQAEVDNAVAGALLDVYGFVPLDVRYKAARYARKVVGDWQEAARHTEPAAPQAPAEPTGRVWDVGDPEPTENGLTVIGREMTPDVIGRYADPTWFREGADRWSGPYAYRLTWAGLLKEHGPVREYRRPAAIEAWLDEPDEYGDNLGGWRRARFSGAPHTCDTALCCPKET